MTAIRNSGGRSRVRSTRRGAAFLVLVVLVLLVLVDATRTLVQGEVASRRNDRDQARVRSMRTAIDVMYRANQEAVENLRLPLDDQSSEFIEVTSSTESSSITARWFRGDQVIDQMTQRIDRQPSEEISESHE